MKKPALQNLQSSSRANSQYLGISQPPKGVKSYLNVFQKGQEWGRKTSQGEGEWEEYIFKSEGKNESEEPDFKFMAGDQEFED